MTELEQAFQRWTTVAELELKFIEKLGQHKMEVAKSELVQAVAAGEWSVARIKASVAQELQAALKRLTRLRKQTARRVERLQRSARTIAQIRDGEDLTRGQLTLVWAAYRVFERATPASTLETMIGTPLHPTARQGVSYVNVAHPDQPCGDPPESVDNVHGLIGWLKRHRYVPRRGTQAYAQVMGALAAVAGVAETEIEKLEAALSKLENGTYNTWQPVVLAALPDSVDVKKIARLGVK
jgi:hypothetical protein